MYFSEQRIGDLSDPKAVALHSARTDDAIDIPNSTGLDPTTICEVPMAPLPAANSSRCEWDRVYGLQARPTPLKADGH